MECAHEIVMLDGECQDCGHVFDGAGFVEPPRPSILERAWDNVA